MAGKRKTKKEKEEELPESQVMVKEEPFQAEASPQQHPTPDIELASAAGG